MRFSPSISYRLHRFSHLTPPTPVKTWSSTALIDAQKDRFARSGQLCRCGALLEGTSVGRWLFLQTFLLVERMRIARSQKQILIFNERERKGSTVSGGGQRKHLRCVELLWLKHKVSIWCSESRVFSLTCSNGLFPQVPNVHGANKPTGVSVLSFLNFKEGKTEDKDATKISWATSRAETLHIFLKKTGWLGSKFEGKRVLTWINNVVFCCYIELHTYEWHF